MRGGLSPETSQALRNALLGIAPSDTEQLIGPNAAPTEEGVGRAPYAEGADEIEGTGRASPDTSFKRPEKSRNEDDG